MSQNNLYSHWRASVLGAVNGLLVGGAAYAILWLSIERENQRLFKEELSGGNVMHVSIGIKWYGLPLIGGIAFTLISYIVHTI